MAELDLKSILGDPTPEESNPQFPVNLDKSRLQQSLSLAIGNDANSAARAFQLSRQTGLPIDTVERNTQEVENTQRLNTLDLDAILGDAPRTAQYLSEPDNARQAHTDIETLYSVETALRKVREGSFNADVGTKEMPKLAQFSEEEQKGFFNNAARLIAQRAGDLGGGFLTVANQVGDALNAQFPMGGFVWNGESIVPDYVSQSEFDEFDGYNLIEDTANALTEFDIGGESRYTWEGVKETFGDDSGVFDKMGEVFGFAIEQGVASLPDMFAVVMNMPAYVVSRAGEIGQERAANKGKDVADIVDTVEALPFATGSALLERLGVDAIKDAGVEAVERVGNKALKAYILFTGKEALKAGAIEGGTEFIQEGIIEYLGANLGTGSDMSMVEAVDQGLAGLVAGGIYGSGAATVTGTVNTAHDRFRRQADITAFDQQRLNTLSRGFANSELRKNNADAFRELVKNMASDTDIQMVLVDPQGAQTFFQGMRLDEQPEAVQSIMQDVSVAIEEGRNIEIPIEVYATDIAGTELEAGLKPYMKLDPDALTPFEAQDRDVQAEIRALASMTAEQLSSEAEVYNDVYGQLVSLGQSDSTASQYAMLHEAFFRTLAKRAGLSPKALYDQYGLGINRQVDPALQQQAREIDPTDVMLDRLRNNDFPQDQDIFGKSLTQFIVENGGIRDEGGELAARDANAGRVGSNTIYRSNGRTLDDIAEIAVEAGYIAERSEQGLLDAIDRELRGQPVYAMGAENSELQNVRNSLEQLQDILDRAEIDINAMDNQQIKQALLGEQGGDVMSQRQTQTQSAEFKRWFGDSKVVDENGDPLVVYHGTASDFDSFNPETIGTKTDDGWLGKGFYFTSDPSAADAYGNQVMPVYLKASNIYDMEGKNFNEVLAEHGGASGFSEWLINEGFDGVKMWSQYMVLDPNQIKSAIGNNGNFDPNNPSILEQASNPKNLYVAHNLNAENIRHIDELGGLAAPSLAVGNIDTGGAFDSFGDITLLADKKLLNTPKVRTFNADVYSPRHPRPEYELNDSDYQKLVDDINALPGNYGAPDMDSLSRGANEMLYNDGVKLLYLKEADNMPPVKKAKAPAWMKKALNLNITSAYDLAENAQFRKIVTKEFQRLVKNADGDPELQAELKKRLFDTAGLPEGFEVRPVNDEYAVYDSQGNAVTASSPSARIAVINFNFENDVEPDINTPKDRLVRERAAEVARYRQNDGIDPIALRQAIGKKFRTQKTQTEFEQWAAEKYKGMVKKARLFKGFTNAGDRRYAEYNLQNVVKEMTRSLQGGEGFNYGAGSVRSAYAVEMRSTKQIQDRRNEIVSKEMMDAVRDESQDRLAKTLDELRPYYRFDSDSFGYLDDASSAIAEGPKGWNEAFDLDAEGRQIITDLIEYLRDLPTEYFEAKAQRAVDLSEFTAAVIPRNTPDDVKQILKDKGLKLRTYKHGDTVSREKAIRAFDNLLFQDGLNATELKDEGDVAKVETGKPVTFHFIHNTESATSIFGVPDKDAPYGRGYEPSARYVSVVSEKTASSASGTFIGGKLTFANPLVIPNAGLTWKKTLSEQYGGLTGKELSKAVIADGYDGIITTEDSYITETVDLTTFDEAKALFQNKQTPRGFFNRDTNQITLTPKADLSTFLHESGHFFLEVMRGLRERDAGIDADLQSIERWAATQGAKTDRDLHEMFASGFETYLMEGKAPTPELQGMFARFKAWLSLVYKQIKNVFASNNLGGIQLSNEVRGVMDRMLATEEAIEQASNEQGVLGPNEMQALGLSEEEAAEYQRMVNAARDEADRNLTTDIMQEMQRERKKWWRDGIEAEAEKVREEINAQAVYQARDFLSGSSMPDGMQEVKLSTSHIRDVYGKQAGRKLNRMTATNGAHPDRIAGMFGYKSGDELVRALLGSMNRQEREAYIRKEAEQRMRDLHGDMLTDGSLDKQARDVLHNDKRADLLLAELRWLNKSAGQKEAPRQYFKSAAEAVLAVTPISQVRPDVHRRNEIKARNNALKAAAKSDYRAAALNQHQAVRQFYLYREAMTVKDMAESHRKRLQQMSKTKYNAREVDPNYIQQLKVLVAAFDLRKSPKDSDARLAQVNKFIQAQKETQPDLIADSFLDSITSWKEMTLDDLMALRDAAENLLTIGKKNSAFEKQKLEENITRLTSNINENVDTPKKRLDDRSAVNRARKSKAQFAAIHRKLESLLQEMDGWQDNGPAQELIFRPLYDAQINEVERLAQEHAELGELFKGFEYLFSGMQANMKDLGLKTDTYEMPVGTEGVTLSLTRGERIVLALNYGNEGNREALREQTRMQMSDTGILKAIGTLTKDELELVNRIWEYVDKFYPELAKVEQEATGVAPQKVEADPFFINGVQMRGGYYPLQADSSLSWKAEMHAVEERAEKLKQGGSVRASTKHGSTIERIGFGRQPVNLSIDGLFKHVDGVVHDLTHRKAVREVDRLTRSEAVREAMIDAVGQEGYRAVNDALTRLAGGNTHPSDLAILNKAMRFSRVAVSYGAMGYSVGTAMLNMTGFLPAIPEVGKRRMLSSIFKEMFNPLDMGREIKEKSVFMDNRAQTINRDVYAILRDIKGNTKWNNFKQYAFWMIQKVDAFVSRAVWDAAHNKALEEGQSEQDAVYAADRTVARTQGTGLKIDLSAVEDQSEVYRALSPMYTYFNAVLNLTIRRAGKAKTGQISKLELMGNMFWIFIATAMVEEFIRGAAEDDEAPEEATLRYGQAVGSYYLGQWFGVRELSGFVRYGQMFETPLQSTISAPFKVAGEGLDLAFDPDAELDKSTLRATTDLLPVLGFPSGAQINRTISYLMDIEESGEDVSPYKLLVTGKTDDTDVERLITE